MFKKQFEMSQGVKFLLQRNAGGSQTVKRLDVQAVLDYVAGRSFGASLAIYQEIARLAGATYVTGKNGNAKFVF